MRKVIWGGLEKGRAKPAVTRVAKRTQEKFFHLSLFQIHSSQSPAPNEFISFGAKDGELEPTNQ